MQKLIDRLRIPILLCYIEINLNTHAHTETWIRWKLECHIIFNWIAKYQRVYMCVIKVSFEILIIHISPNESLQFEWQQKLNVKQQQQRRRRR